MCGGVCYGWSTTLLVGREGRSENTSVERPRIEKMGRRMLLQIKKFSLQISTSHFSESFGEVGIRRKRSKVDKFNRSKCFNSKLEGLVYLSRSSAHSHLDFT